MFGMQSGTAEEANNQGGCLYKHNMYGKAEEQCLIVGESGPLQQRLAHANPAL